ncbi:MAG: hypothetical protein HDR09_09295 [Lachnospiraceae bacterium]|nr:hypothetical protein [Lachnospiraceae bacterium]
MGINGIGANYYQAGYTNNEATKAEAGKSFAEIASQKVAEADKQYCLDRASAAFDTIGEHAPDEVKQAWMEAVEETGTNVSFSKDGDRFHIPLPQLMVQRVVRWLKGEVDPGNLLGNSVESAISVIEKAIYDIDHPLPGSPTRSIEEQQDTKKERAFYVAFLEKLKGLL